MRTNLTSLITLNKVSTKFYKPGNDYERALLTRYERVQTQIVENQNEAARQIADDIVARLRKKQKKNETFVLTKQEYLEPDEDLKRAVTAQQLMPGIVSDIREAYRKRRR